MHKVLGGGVSSNVHLSTFVYYLKLVGFAARARPCAARTRLFELIATQNRALRAPLIAASLLLIQHPEIYKIYRTWAAHVKGFFLSTGTHAD
jgi:hypothetical protein